MRKKRLLSPYFCQLKCPNPTPPFQITPAILNQVAGIAQVLGQLTSFKQPETTLSEADIKAFLECHAGYYLYAACSSGGWWAVPTLRRIISRNGYVQAPQLCQNIRRNAQKPLIVALLLPIHKYPNHTPHLSKSPPPFSIRQRRLRFRCIYCVSWWGPLRWDFKDFSTVKCCYFLG
jgi:hypothetical protein